MISFNDINEKLKKYHQQHLLRFYNDLEDQQKVDFLEHLNTIDYENVNLLFNRATEPVESEQKELDSRLEPILPSQFEAEETCLPLQWEEYRLRGLKEISLGHVGVLLMAGGQGTRLGVTYPKGMYSVGLPSGKSLFQIHAERIRRLQFLAEKATGRKGVHIPWYIMTSGPTHEETIEYLERNNYFGLDKDNVILFKQGLLPCFTFDGKIILTKRNEVALSPDGNGGIYRALERNGMLEDMEKRGVQHVHGHSVDNILTKVADPVFIGYCAIKEACCGAKVVSKASPTEAVGIVCRVDGRYQVVEYSEVSEETANKRNEKGDLVFSAGNICNHYFKVRFLRKVAETHESELKIHIAKKKIAYVDDDGITQKPKTANGIKLEKFVFDVFPFANNFQAWEVPRRAEFSALKNPNESARDCPETARRDLLSLHKQYVEDNGGEVHGEVEISPLVSYSGEDLGPKVKGKVFEAYMSVHIQSDEEIAKLQRFNDDVANGN